MQVPELPRAIEGRAELQQALRAALAEVAERGVREMWWCDADFNAWPINEPATIATLTAWARPHRRLVVCARSFDGVLRRHPRWVTWRRTWAHLVDCRTIECTDQELLPTLLLAPPALLLRVDGAQQPRGLRHADVEAQADAGRLIDAYLQRSGPALPPTTLGL